MPKIYLPSKKNVLHAFKQVLRPQLNKNLVKGLERLPVVRQGTLKRPSSPEVAAFDCHLRGGILGLKYCFAIFQSL